MFRSLSANHVRMVIAGSTAIVSLLITGCTTTWVEINKCWELNVWMNVCLLQIVGGIFLFVGSLKSNHWLFLPWLLAGCIFIYTLVYKSILYFYNLDGRMLLVVPVFQSIAGFWSYFMYDVFQDFLQMHTSVQMEY
ncbi:uncharacterized protein LOC120445718 [Drosophila santomea]|uniref:uncharacterized protein LOC120445718 n=1 Tax=Drosophila santomea TaxID=129105 RepID=UPI001953FE04|nr:uncharacterized protein LOC120445718 [Drosophila santomea]XP_039482220.1 uncharacterized protein LOC120445718 [Drosophila santomea]XP_039482221.1 uncharacterized protein LOC120445718 [Drosophila santomea]